MVHEIARQWVVNGIYGAETLLYGSSERQTLFNARRSGPILSGFFFCSKAEVRGSVPILSICEIQSSRTRTLNAATNGTASSRPITWNSVPIMRIAETTTTGCRVTARLITTGRITCASIWWIAMDERTTHTTRTGSIAIAR